MGLDYDAVLLNIAVARAGDPAAIAETLPGQWKPGAWRPRPTRWSRATRDMAAPSAPLPGRPFS